MKLFSLFLSDAVIWLKYCRYGVNPYSINQSINLFHWLLLNDPLENISHVWRRQYHRWRTKIFGQCSLDLRPLRRESTWLCHSCCGTGLWFFVVVSSEGSPHFTRLLRQSRGIECLELFLAWIPTRQVFCYNVAETKWFFFYFSKMLFQNISLIVKYRHIKDFFASIIIYKHYIHSLKDWLVPFLWSDTKYENV